MLATTIATMHPPTATSAKIRRYVVSAFADAVFICGPDGETLRLMWAAHGVTDTYDSVGEVPGLQCDLVCVRV